MADLCTLADVREFLRMKGTETNDDGVLTTLVTAASSEIANYTSREFATSSATRRFKVTPGRSVDGLATVELLANDLRVIDSMVLGPQDASPTTLTLGTYILAGGPDIIGAYCRVLLARSQSINGTDSWSTFGYSEVDIAGQWGAVSVPDIVKQACVVTVADWYRQKVAAFSRTFDESGIYTKPAPLPDAVCGWLAPFLRYTA